MTFNSHKEFEEDGSVTGIRQLVLKQTNLIGKIILKGSTGGLSRRLVGERKKSYL